MNAVRLLEIPRRRGQPWSTAVSGYIRLYRSLADHALWLKERFTPGQAWVDLLMRANYHDGKVLRGNRWIPVLRGQVFTSQKELAARWSWDRKTVSRLLLALNASNMVDTQTSKETDTGYTIVTIRNYEKYQGHDADRLDIELDTGKDIERDIESPSKGHRCPTSKKVKNNTPPIVPLNGFNQFWLAYPKKESKQPAIRAWQKLNPSEALTATILEALERQKPRWQWTKDKGRFIPYPATWLNNKRWEDELPSDGDEDPYKDWPRLYDCARCGECHDTPTCLKEEA